MSDLEARIAAAIARLVADHGHAPAYVVTHPDDGIECETVGGTTFCHDERIPRGNFITLSAPPPPSLVDGGPAYFYHPPWFDGSDEDWAAVAFKGKMVSTEEFAHIRKWGQPPHPNPRVAEESRRFERDMDAVEPIRGKP